MKAKSKYLFETSWEVVNKVGGINTVIKTKADVIDKYYPHYYLIGPYFKDKCKLEVTLKNPPKEFINAFSEVEKKGIKLYYGTWEIKGKPNVILVDFKNILNEKNQIKRNLWDWFKVDSLYSNYDFDEPTVWSYCVGILLEQLSNSIDENIVAQFHEWLSGAGLLYIKHKKIKNIATVFTTHATMLGRTIAGNNLDLYNLLNKINPEQSAKDFGIMDKFTMEKASANNADVFTTVSKITALEAEKLLGRKPEVLVLNGVDLTKYPTFEENSVKHTKYREQIREFLKAYFYPYYYFDMKKSLTFFISARYEYRNKGIDLTIKALGKLNQILKQRNSNKTIIVFFWIPRQNQGVKKEILENKTRYKNIINFVSDFEKEINRNIVDTIVSGNEINTNIFPIEFVENMRIHYLKFRKQGTPSLTTNIFDENNDSIINGFKQAGLWNRKEDKVKVIYYPLYLTGFDGLLDLRYNEAILGTHLGIFPSYYEPWGYTPIETMSLGVPAITTDLSGFGQYMQSRIIGSNQGLWVLKRKDQDEENTLNDFVEVLLKYTLTPRYERVLHKMNAKALSEFSDWNILIENYIKAHNLAISKMMNNK